MSVAIEQPLRISIIVPTLNEADNIVATLAPLQRIRQHGHEVIVVDGGSRDATIALATPLADQVIPSSAGRALQMNAGAAIAQGTLLWFLHADTQVPAESETLLSEAWQAQHEWGRFNVRLSGRHPLFWLIARLMNLRSCWSGIATGDQAIFVRRILFEAVGGYPVQPLMEEIALSKTLKRVSRPCCITTPVITSSRRWEQRGIISTILLMWRLRLLYALGADPAQLARLYR